MTSLAPGYRDQTALGRQGYVLLRFLGAPLATC
jgi:hypothetical protein